jgi:hypothetical protein
MQNAQRKIITYNIMVVLRADTKYKQEIKCNKPVIPYLRKYKGVIICVIRFSEGTAFI